VSWYQKGKTNLDFTEARDSEWQWHQLGHMQVCTLLQTDNHSVFTGRMPFLSPNQQRQSTVEQQSGTNSLVTFALHFLLTFNEAEKRAVVRVLLVVSYLNIHVTA